MIRTQLGLAIFGYVTATLIGLYLVISTLVQDRRDQERAKLKGK